MNAGEMKTYWLTGKTARPSYVSSAALNSEATTSTRGYSPITLEDVAKKSSANSPTPGARQSTPPAAPGTCKCFLLMTIIWWILHMKIS